MSCTSTESNLNPNQRLRLSHSCLVLDRNIPDCREYFFGEVSFNKLSLWIEYPRERLPFDPHETYFRKEVERLIGPSKYHMLHKYSYRGIKIVMRLDEYNFVVCGSRQNVQIRIQDNIGAENFVDTLLDYQVGSRLVWNKEFESPRYRPSDTKDQLLDPNVPMRVREDFETLSAVSRLIGKNSWNRYVNTQKALQKDVLTYWVNYHHHQDSLGPQVGLAKDLVMDKSNFEMILKIRKIIKRDLETMRRELDDYESDLDTLLANFKKIYPIYDDTTRWRACRRILQISLHPSRSPGTPSVQENILKNRRIKSWILKKKK